MSKQIKSLKILNVMMITTLLFSGAPSNANPEQSNSEYYREEYQRVQSGIYRTTSPSSLEDPYQGAAPVAGPRRKSILHRSDGRRIIDFSRLRRHRSDKAQQVEQDFQNNPELSGGIIEEENSPSSIGSQAADQAESSDLPSTRPQPRAPRSASKPPEKAPAKKGVATFKTVAKPDLKPVAKPDLKPVAKPDLKRSEVSATVSPAATATSAAAEKCEPGVTPSSGASNAAKQATSLREITNQQVASTPAPPEEEQEKREYEEVNEEVRKRPLDITPIKTGNAPKSAFVQRLLKYAGEEVCRPRRVRGRLVHGCGYKSMCLQGVRMAFQRANGESTAAGWTLHAKNAGPFLKKYGYRRVAVTNAKEAPPGSVFIYIAPGQPKKSGHIEIKGTNGFYSDGYSRHMINQGPKPLNRKLTEVWVPN